MTTISIEELQDRLNAGEKLNILDVREPHENSEFNIGGLLLPLGQIQSMQLDEIENWKEDEVIVYCRSGNRSGQACLILAAAGFSNVKNLTGGMLHWREKFQGNKHRQIFTHYVDKQGIYKNCKYDTRPVLGLGVIK